MRKYDFGALDKLEPEFEKRSVKVMGLSVDAVEDHNAWLDDIEEVTDSRPSYPIVADSELKIAKLYGMIQNTQLLEVKLNHFLHKLD